MLEVHAIPLLTDKYDVWLRYFVLQLQRHTLYRVESLVFRGIVLPVRAENNKNIELKLISQNTIKN